jgi:putative peptidoglycan lipid II flippase
VSLFRNVAVQALITGGSRILGFARDVVLAAQIGANPISDAFNTAQQFPNLFRRVFGEGAFSQAFVPSYARTLQSEGAEAAERVAADVLVALTIATAALTVIAQLAMPWIMLAVHYGYRNDPPNFNLAILLTQITMPYLACMAISALLSGVLNTAGRFALSAGAPTLMNLCLLIAALMFEEPRRIAVACSVALTISGVLQAALLWWGCRRQGVKIRLHPPRLTKPVREVIALAVPGAIAASVVQINILVSQSFASIEVGAKTWLSYADRLYQLPLGLIGVAVGVAIVPRLSRALAAGNPQEGSRLTDEALVLSMAFTLPAAAALLVMPGFLSDGLFARGAFTSEDAAMTASALFHFGWGVPAFVLLKIFAPGYFARRDTMRPMIFGLISVVANIALGVSLFMYLQHLGHPGFPGLAVATSAAAWINLALLAGVQMRRGDWRMTGEAAGRLARVGAATTVMGVAVGVMAANRDALEGLLLGFKELALALTILVGGLVYVVAAFALRAVTPAEVRAALRRAPGASAAGLGGGEG